MERKSEYRLNNLPNEAISAVKFCQSTDEFLLVSSWDSSVRLLDIVDNTMVLKYTHKSPVLDCVFMGSTSTVSGGLDSTVKLVDLNSQVETIIGDHDYPINCLEYSSKVNGIFSGSWDKTIKLWDVRQKECAGTYEQSNGKVYGMSVVDEKIAVATSECQALIWDLRMMKQYLIRHVLKHQPRSIKVSPNKKCYVIGTYDGRVDVNYIKRDPEVRKRRATFKCHRMKVNKFEYVYVVNCISFHNYYNTFATGGSNGFINIWDGFSKRRLYQYHRYDSSVASLAFTNDGNKLAIACSDLNILDKPKEEIPPPTIKVRYVNEKNVNPNNEPESGKKIK